MGSAVADEGSPEIVAMLVQLNGLVVSVDPHDHTVQLPELVLAVIDLPRVTGYVRLQNGSSLYIRTMPGAVL